MPQVAVALAPKNFHEPLTQDALPKAHVLPALRFRHILVPTDLTSRTDRVLDIASHLAGADDSRITLLHVIETIDGLSEPEIGTFYDHLERKARVAMTRFEMRTWSVGVQCHADVVYGKRAETIVEYAATHDVDLIVLASHKVNPSAGAHDFATISYKAGIFAPCPVLLVK